MTKTFSELKEIDALHGKLLRIEGFDNTKLAYAFKRFSEKNIVPTFSDFNEELQFMRIDNALTDKITNALLYQPGSNDFQYSPEALKNVLRQSKEITKKWENKDIEIVPYICSEIPPTVQLSEEDVALLKEVII